MGGERGVESWVVVEVILAEVYSRGMKKEKEKTSYLYNENFV